MLGVLPFVLALSALLPASAAGSLQGSPKQVGKRADSFNSTAKVSSADVSLQILTKTGLRNDTAPYLYGWMFEDISHSGDGGIYGELLQNRGFEGSNVSWGAPAGYTFETITGTQNTYVPYGPVLDGYAPVGNSTLRLDLLHPLSYSHQIVMELNIPTTVNGSLEPVGFLNTGWWGIPVTPQSYNVSFYIYPDQVRNQYNPSTSITVSLASSTTGQVWASTVIPAQSWSVVDWTYVTAALVCNETAPDANNVFTLTFDSTEAAGQTYYFSLISLFGETFKDYPNGLRKDLAEVVYDLKPRFLRWPGGNNLEGISFQRRWKWWETIGPLKDRWARPGTWYYYNTNGLGLLEYLEWAEAMEMENVLAIYSGYSLGREEEYLADQYPCTDAALAPLLQEALDELEFCMGDVSTTWGSKRAAYGHPEPFDIKYVEIGNEDYVSTNYDCRWLYFYEGLSAVYPDITYISTGYNENADYLVDLKPGTMWDTHHYETPSFFIEAFDTWDNWQEASNNTNVTIFVGEYSVRHTDAGVRVTYPYLSSAIAEGVYLLGAERNPNVVKLTSYAPSLQNINYANWTPNLLIYDANPNATVVSTSYWLQATFNKYHGTQTLTVENPTGDFDPLYWAASIDGEDTVYLKVINVGAVTTSLSVTLESTWSSVNGTIITGAKNTSYNAPTHPSDVFPVALDLNVTRPDSNGFWSWDVPAYSITVLQFDLD